MPKGILPFFSLLFFLRIIQFVLAFIIYSDKRKMQSVVARCVLEMPKEELNCATQVIKEAMSVNIVLVKTPELC